MAKISKTSSYEFYHCTNCKELTPSIMVIEYEAKTRENSPKSFGVSNLESTIIDKTFNIVSADFELIVTILSEINFKLINYKVNGFVTIIPHKINIYSKAFF